MYHLTEDEWTAVRQLRDEKYATWEWNYGASPTFNVQRSRRFAGGEVDVRLFVEKGMIKEVTIYGDFFGSAPIDALQQQLEGIQYRQREIHAALQAVDIEQYMAGVPSEGFEQLVYGEDADNE